jgi:hypothetical protein
MPLTPFPSLGLTGLLTTGRVPFATGVSTLIDTANFTWNNGTNTLTISGTIGTTDLNVGVGSGAAAVTISYKNANTGQLQWNPSAPRILTLPDATDTLIGRATTDTLTNKSISGSANTLTNIPNSALTNNSITVTSGTGITVAGSPVALGGAVTVSVNQGFSPTWTGTHAFTLAINMGPGTGASAVQLNWKNANTGTLQWTPSTTRTLTLPDATDTLVGKATTDTFTNKSISGSTNTLTNIPNAALTNSSITLTSGTGVTVTGSPVSLGGAATIAVDQAFSPTWTGAHTWSGTGTATFASNAAHILNAGGTQFSQLTSAATATRTVTFPDATITVVGQNNTQTITNKTIDGSNNTLSNIANASLVNSSITINVPSAVFAGSGAVSLGGTSSITLQTQTANFVWAGPTTGVPATPTFRALVANDIPSLTGTYLPLAGGTMSGAITFSGTQLGTYTLGGTYTFGGTPTIGSSIAVGTTATYSIGGVSSLLVAIATAKIIGGASNTTGHTVPNVVDDTFALLAASQTITNKTISGASNTITNIGNGSLTNSSITVTNGAGINVSGSPVSLGGAVTVSVGGTADATYSTGAFTWSGASGKAMALTSTAATISITAGSASTWDSADGTIKATSLDRTTGGSLLLGSATATSLTLGGSNLTSGMNIGSGNNQSINFQWAGTTGISMQTNGALLQFARGGTRNFNIGAEVVDTAGDTLAIAAGGGGAASVTGGGTGGQISTLGGQGGTATTSLAAGAGGQATMGGGVGGTGAASGQGPGAGGLAIWRGGTGGTVTGGFSGGNGGNAAIRGGLATGTGTNGNVLIGDTNTSAVTIAGMSGAITITAGTTSTWDSKDGTVKAATFDTTTGIAMAIGGSLATQVSIGRSGQNVLFPGGTLRAATPGTGVAAVAMLFGLANGASASGATASTAGGTTTIQGGQGGTASTTGGGTAGNGGITTVVGGKGGDGAATTNGPGAGAGVDVLGGAGGTQNGTGSAAGGNVRIRGGAGTGGGPNGTVTFGDTNTSAISLGASGITTTITGNLTQLTGTVSLTGNGASTFTTSSSTLTLDAATTLQLGLNTGNASLGRAAGITTISGGSTSSFDMSGGSGIFSTTTGTNTLNGNVVIAVGKTLSASISAIGTAQTVHTSILNPTAATNGAQQYSPMIELGGQGFNITAAASRAAKWGIQVAPGQQSVGDPVSDVVFYSSSNASAYLERIRLVDTATGAGIKLGGTSTNSLVILSGFSTTQVNSVAWATTQTLFPDRDNVAGYSVGSPTLRYYDTFSIRGNHSSVGIGDAASLPWATPYITTTGYTTSIGINSQQFGLRVLGAGARFQAMTTPVVTVTAVGTTGATSRTYQVVAVGLNGATTLAGSGTQTNLNAALTSTNYDAITWPAVPGAAYYDVYITSVGQATWLGSTTTTTFNDKIGSGASNGIYTAPGAGAVFGVVSASIGATGGTGTAQTYFVYAQDADGHLSAVATKASAPTASQASPVTLTWNAIGGAVNYWIAAGANTNIIGSSGGTTFGTGSQTLNVNVPNGGLLRAGGTTVTGTIPNGHGLRVGDSFTLTSADANYPSGTYTVASVTGVTTFTYASAGTNVASTNVAISYVGPSVAITTFIDYGYPARVIGSATRNSTGDVVFDGQVQVNAQTVGNAIINKGNSSNTSAIEVWKDGAGTPHFGIDDAGFPSLGALFEFRECWMWGGNAASGWTSSTKASTVIGNSANAWILNQNSTAGSGFVNSTGTFNNSPLATGITFNVGTASGGSAQLQMGSPFIKLNNITNMYVIAEWSAGMSVVSVNQTVYRWGYSHVTSTTGTGSVTSAAHPGGAWFENSNGGAWSCKTDDLTTTTTTVTGVSPVANNCQTFRIEQYGSGTMLGANTVIFYIDGVQVAKHTTNVYTASDVTFNFGGTTAAIAPAQTASVGQVLLMFNTIAVPVIP